MPITAIKSALNACAAAITPAGGGSGCKRCGAGAGLPSMSVCL